MTEVLIFGSIAAFNMLIILVKIKLSRKLDATLDAGILFLLNSMAGGTLTGMMIATIASLLVSIFLFFFKPEIFKDGWLNDKKYGTERRRNTGSNRESWGEDSFNNR